jgi:aquaporin TIP
VPEDALRRGVAEFVGTFTLIFIGAGAIVAAGQIHDPSLIGVAMAHGLAIAIMVSALGHISGGHFNPAVTFGMLVTRRIQPALGMLYWLSQLAGAALAALLLRELLPTVSTNAVELGVPAVGHGVGPGAAFGLEAIMTFFLVWVVFATAVDPRGTFKSIAGLAIGLTITMDILLGGP